MGESAIITIAVSLALMVILSLVLGFYTVKNPQARSVEWILELAVSVIHLRFSVRSTADRDDPEGVAAPAEQGQIEREVTPPAVAGSIDDEAGGGP